MRVYIPISLSGLRQLHALGQVTISRGLCATAALLSSYGLDADDVEMGEAVAMALAAGASRIGDAAGSPLIRCVIAADIDADAVEVDEVLGEASFRTPITMANVVSIHLDTEPTAVPPEDELEDVAQLQWFDVAEVASVVARFDVEGH